jgi:hypothetical protein
MARSRTIMPGQCIRKSRCLPPVAAAATSTSGASTTAAAAAATTLALRLSFVHHEGTTTKVRAVESFHRLSGAAVIGHFHEAESARAACVPVSDDSDRSDFTELAERLAEFFLRRVERHIAHVNVHHLLLQHRNRKHQSGGLEPELRTVVKSRQHHRGHPYQGCILHINPHEVKRERGFLGNNSCSLWHSLSDRGSAYARPADAVTRRKHAGNLRKLESA